MMPERNEVVVVGEGQDPLAVLLRDGEQVLEDAHHLKFKSQFTIRLYTIKSKN
jgi:aldehyde:ferredoxin oxidoreductase